MRINQKKATREACCDFRASGCTQPRCRRVSESGNPASCVVWRSARCLLFTAVFVGCGTEASDEPVDSQQAAGDGEFFIRCTISRTENRRRARPGEPAWCRPVQSPTTGAVHKGYYPDGSRRRFLSITVRDGALVSDVLAGYSQ